MVEKLRKQIDGYQQHMQATGVTQTYIFLFQQQKLILRFFNIFCHTGNDDRIGSVKRGEPDVHLVCIHEFTDGTTFGANQTAVNPRVDRYLDTYLILLYKNKCEEIMRNVI